jgi:DNA-binding GntR family transcriptional regulator
MSEESTLYRTIGQQIAERIRRDVLSGELEAGEPLREQDLAKRFGVSRGPIRDALLRLTQEGVLVAKPNRGATVSQRASDEIQPLIVELRRAIEIFALKNAFDKFDSETLSRLKRIAEKMREDFERRNTRALAEDDMMFHRLLVETSGERDLVALWMPVVIRMLLHYARYKEPTQVFQEHMAIIDAICRDDLEAAIKALEENIQ